ncbi:MAG: hypothetical protein IJH60_08170 [Eubacterium sp.]|nr:hypothetical protein [Eubacterium sp.]
MKNSRKKILQNIQEKDGTYQYTGESFRLKTPMTTLVICCILTFLLVVISGTLDTAAAFGAFYVILPYVGEVSALFMLVWNSVRLFYNRDNMRGYILDHVRSRIPGAATVLSLCALLGMACSLFYLFRYGTGGQLTASILYLICKGASALLALECRKAFRKLEWEKV